MVFETIDDYESALQLAIHGAMEGSVTENAMQAIADSVESHVYSYPTDAYFEERRRHEFGGHQDEWLMLDEYNAATFTLTIKMKVPWQHLWGGPYPSADLSDVIEQNGMYGAPPRKFMKPAEDEYASKQFRNDLIMALKSAGL